MDKMWILLFIVIGIGAIVIGSLKFCERRKLRRLRNLKCPKCGLFFQVEGLLSLKRWMEFSVENPKKMESGFYLHCHNCGVDFQFKDNRNLVCEVSKKWGG